VTELLYFLCGREYNDGSGIWTPPGFVNIKNPVGSAIVAFTSRELGEAVIRFRGQEASLFLVSEPQLSPELVGSLPHRRVFVYHSAADYDALAANPADFPWAEHMVDYDFAAALARGAA
jgi:hypothetical protein